MTIFSVQRFGFAWAPRNPSSPAIAPWDQLYSEVAAASAVQTPEIRLDLQSLHCAASTYTDLLAALPKPVDVAQGQGVQRARLADF
jgi:hypothetical protein